MSDYYETNKKRWNELVGIHANTEEYDIEGFLAGQNTLKPVELNILGDVKGKSLLPPVPLRDGYHQLVSSRR